MPSGSLLAIVRVSPAFVGDDMASMAPTARRWAPLLHKKGWCGRNIPLDDMPQPAGIIFGHMLGHSMFSNMKSD